MPSDPELVRFLRDDLGEAFSAGGTWEVTAPLWLWRGKAKDGSPTKAAWTFVTIAGPVAEALRAAASGRSVAWGSIYVTARIGGTSWQTSVFPSKDVDGYLLPVKASVRKAEHLNAGDRVTLVLSC